MIGIGEFCAIVTADERDAARARTDERAAVVSGSYPDAVGVVDLDRLDAYEAILQRHDGLIGPPAGMMKVSRYPVVPLAIPPIGFGPARIEYRRGKYLAHIPGLREPMELRPEWVFRREAFDKAPQDSIGDPPHLPPVVFEPDGSTSEAEEKLLREYGQKYAEWSGRREVARWKCFRSLLDGKASIPTGSGRRVENELRERQRREVAQVRPVPNLVAELQRAVHPEKRSSGERQAILREHGKVSVVERDHGRVVRATLTEPSRNAVMGRPSKSPRWTGKVEATPALPWQWNGEVVVGANATAHDLGEQMIALVAELDVDFHRTVTAVTGEIQANGSCVVSALHIHRLRGARQKMNADERRRYEGHLELLRSLYYGMELPGGTRVELPLVARGPRTSDRKKEVLYAVSPQQMQGMPTSVIGLMMDPAFGHRAGFLLDKRLVELDEIPYALGIYLARQWAARMTIRAVEGHAGKQAHSLEAVLDATPMREHWRTRMANRGRPWLRDTVERALADIRAVGLYGAAGTATVKWNENDIGKSHVVFGEPPPHIVEAHQDRASKRIQGAIRKRKRLDEQGDDRPARRRRKKPTS